MKVAVFADGGAWPNPGPAACAAVVVDEHGDIIAETARLIEGHATNNVAEYRAVLLGCSLVNLVGATSAFFYSDSMLIVQQIRGAWFVVDSDLKILRQRARDALNRIDEWKIDHIYREHNRRADWLCDELLNHKAKKHPAEAPAAGFVVPRARARNGAQRLR